MVPQLLDAERVPSVDLPDEPPPIPHLGPELPDDRLPPAPLDALLVDPLVEMPPADLLLLNWYRQEGWGRAIDGVWARKKVLERLQLARRRLPQPFDFAVFDAWRSLELQRDLYEHFANGPVGATPPGAVAAPTSDPLKPPPHLTGGAIDLTLSWRGKPLALGTSFDEFGDAAHTAHFEGEPGPVRTLRRLLYWALREQGFVVLAEEWWHFECGTRQWAALRNEPVLYGSIRPADH